MLGKHRCVRGRKCAWISDYLPWACRATFESDSSLSRHLPLSPSPLLFCYTYVPESTSGCLAKLAPAMFKTKYTLSCLLRYSTRMNEDIRKRRLISIFREWREWQHVAPSGHIPSPDSGDDRRVCCSLPLTDDSHVDNIHLPLSQEVMLSGVSPKHRSSIVT